MFSSTTLWAHFLNQATPIIPRSTSFYFVHLVNLLILHHPLLNLLVPLSSTFIHFPPLSSTFIHFHPPSHYFRLRNTHIPSCSNTWQRSNPLKADPSSDSSKLFVSSFPSYGWSSRLHTQSQSVFAIHTTLLSKWYVLVAKFPGPTNPSLLFSTSSRFF